MVDTEPGMRIARGTGKPDFADAPRHIFGPRPVGALVPGLVRAAFKRSPATAQVLADWEAIVGPMLAEATVPRKLAAGTLTLACAGPVALELQHFAPMLIERINTHLGRPAVERLRFVQVAPRHAPPPRPVPTTADPAAERAVAKLPPGPLRDALLALGRAVLRRK